MIVMEMIALSVLSSVPAFSVSPEGFKGLGGVLGPDKHLVSDDTITLHVSRGVLDRGCWEVGEVSDLLLNLFEGRRVGLGHPDDKLGPVVFGKMPANLFSLPDDEERGGVVRSNHSTVVID